MYLALTQILLAEGTDMMTGTRQTRFPGGIVFPAVLFLGLSWGTACDAAPPDRVRATKPHCAFVAAGGVTVADLAEAKLLERSYGTWLERNEIDRVLAEQELAASFAPGSARQRITLGQLLKADVLVLLRTERMSEDSPANRIDLVVSETTGGLRILAHSLPQSSDAEADADKLVNLVDKAMAKYGETIREVYAVPPFLSRDLGQDNNHLMAAYAALMERVLLAQPGVLVVETAEAEAIAREYALADPADRPRHPLPDYLWGEYRHDGLGDSLRITIRLETKRGDTVLHSTSHTMSPTEAIGYLERAAIGLMEHHGDGAVPFDAEAEARQLAYRSGDFLLLRDWQQALNLAELCLLLAPDQVDARRTALIALHRLSERYSIVAHQSEALRLRRRTFQHIVQALNGHDERVAASTVAKAMCWQAPRKPAPEVRQQIDIEGDYAMRMAYHYAERGIWDKSRALLLATTMRMPDGQQVDEKLAFLSKYKRRMDTATRIWVIDSSLTLSEKEKTRLRNTILSWEDLNEDLRARTVMRQRRAKERAASWKERIAEDRKWETMPVTEPAVPSALTFRALEVNAQREDKSIAPMPIYRRCLSLDDGSDVFWSLGSIFVCHVTSTKHGKLLRTSSVDGTTRYSLNDMASDGRYLWLVSKASGKCPRLDVMEPQAGQTWSITEEHGLPHQEIPTNGATYAGIPRLHVAPLGYGEAIVAGYHGDAWLAHVRFDPEGKHRVTVFHEAQELHVHSPIDPIHHERDDSCWNPQIAFEPRGIGTWTFPDSGERRVVIARDVPDMHCAAFRKHPLLVNPNDLTVSVMKHCWSPRQAFDSEIIRNQVQIAATGKQLDLIRFCHPEHPPQLLFSNILAGQLVVDGDTVHVIGREWQRGNLTERTWQSLGETPWNYGSLSDKHAGPLRKREFGLISAFRSNIFGPVVVLAHPPSRTRGIMAQVLFDGSGVSLRDLTSSR